MLDDEKLQIVGPIAVVIAVGSADFGARALAYWPSSPLLWYLNLEVFQSIRHSALVDSGLAFGNSVQTLCVVIPLLTLIGLGLLAKIRFPLAIASNMSLLYGLLLLSGSALTNSAQKITDGTGSASSFTLVASILLTALISSATSHRAYWQDLIS